MRKKPAPKPKTIGEIFAEGTAIDEALRAGAAEALRRHKRAGKPIAVWENGKVVLIPAKKIKVPASPRRLKNRVHFPSSS
jgi:hypothetical protein